MVNGEDRDLRRLREKGKKWKGKEAATKAYILSAIAGC